jgi:hypothetical protein
VNNPESAIAARTAIQRPAMARYFSKQAGNSCAALLLLQQHSHHLIAATAAFSFCPPSKTGYFS